MVRAMSEQPAVLTERRDGVLVITLNRPEVRNAVNGAVAEGIAKALDELDADDGLAVGVLTGAGGFFCAGMDLGAFVKGESPWYGDRGFAGIAQRASRKPLIAAIEGFAVAGGFEVALACDLIVAAEGAKLGIPEAKRSLVAAGGALLRLPRRMPYHVVMELALTGDPMPAERFRDFGVVNRIAPAGGALDAALARATTATAAGALTGAVANAAGAIAVLLGIVLADPPGWRATAILALLAAALLLQAAVDLALRAASARA
jgi:enoyl-CoA hydratase